MRQLPDCLEQFAGDLDRLKDGQAKLDRLWHLAGYQEAASLVRIQLLRNARGQSQEAVPVCPYGVRADSREAELGQLLQKFTRGLLCSVELLRNVCNLLIGTERAIARSSCCIHCVIQLLVDSLLGNCF